MEKSSNRWIKCQQCGKGAVWVGGMLWQCDSNHRFIVDSSRPIGQPHRFI